MTKLLIVTCTKTKTDTEFQTRPIFNSLKKQYDLNPNTEIYIFKDNKKGLSTCYNEILKNKEHKGKTVLFVHDDVVLEDIFLYEKLTNSPYSITGLAGAKTFNKSANKLAWHLASTKDNFVGEVAHANNGRIWTTCFGPTNSRSLVLDGLFLSCKTDILNEKELYFDENFPFHFYDISFCLRANEKKVTCGVLPIRAIHSSLGDSMLTKEWEESNLIFKKLYCS